VSETDERINSFAPLSKSEWLEKVEADLKGSSPDRLRTRMPGGIEVEPLYTAEDAPDSSAAGVPGAYPYVRGAAALGGWLIRQEYDDPRPDVCKAQIDEDLARGVEAVWFEGGPRGGCRVLTVSDLDAVLAPVDLATTSVCIDGGADSLSLAAGLLAVASKRGVDRDALRGGFAVDPIGVLALDGQIQGGLSARMRDLCDLSTWCSEQAPGLRSAWVSSEPYVGGGASTPQELAYVVATGLAYLRAMSDAGLAVDDAARRIGFALSVSGDFFTQIAKLRAARELWAKVVTAAGGGPESAAMHVHARTARFTKSRRDPWVNMLRTTAECTAAVLGGAQSVATLPFDEALGTPEELARRVARNTQVVLREESHLDAVVDPAGGSWFVEALTDDLARAAWAELQRVEASGGIVKALGNGLIVDAIGAVSDERRQAIEKRKSPIVGVSEFPNADEATVEREQLTEDDVRKMLRVAVDALDVGSHRDQLVGLAQRANDPELPMGGLTEACVEAAEDGLDLYSIAAVLQHGQPEFHLEPVRQWRASEEWEGLRARSEKSSTRPAAFLANLGPIPAHKARSTWAQNLLSAAGIAAEPNDGFSDPKSVADGWSDASASLAVICGSDADYETMLEPTVTALKQAGCPVVLVAGRPGDRAAELREAGASDFVYMGADVLSIMGNVLDSVGVER
jgi:methylmalonyl-CoA mutase